MKEIHDVPAPAGSWAILDALSEPALVVDAASFCVLAVNSRLCREFGIASAEWCHRPLDRLARISTRDSSRLYSILADGGDPVTVEAALPSRGAEVTVALTLSRFQEGERGLGLALLRSGVAGTSRSTGNLSSRLRKLFDHSNDIIFTYDTDGRLTSINPAGLNVFGFTLDEMVGQPLSLIADRDSLRETIQKYRSLFETGKPTPGFELRCYTKNRESIWIELSVLRLMENGADLGALGMGRDVTERKRAEQAMLDSQRRLREQKTALSRVIDQNPYAIALWKTDGEMRQCNNAFVRLIGIVPGAGYNLLRDPQAIEAGVQDAFDRALNGETVFLERAKYDVARYPGSRAPSKPVRFSLTLFPVVDSQDCPVQIVTIFQDLARQIEERAARELLEAQLRQAQKMEAIGTLAGGVAHDFNNLLTGVIGYLDIIRAEAAPELHSYVNKAEKAAQRACELTRQLLAYARKNRMEIIAHDMNSTLAEVAALVAKTIDPRIAVKVEPSNEPATVLADPGQMNQVLMNLCINAGDAVKDRLEAQPHGERWKPSIRVRNRRVYVKPEARLRTGAGGRREGWFSCLSVFDTGTGMDPETRPRIFDPFFTTKPVGRGTGLGLATIFGIVSQHEGWIDVLSKPGTGSLFRVYLPLVDAEPEVPSDAAASVRVPGGKETVLLVDDEETIRELGRDILEGRGYRVMVAADGDEALTLFREKHPEIDLVLLDLAMPRLSGQELLPFLKELAPSVPVIASSGYSPEGETRALLENGVVAFVEKPYHAFDLLRAVRQACDGVS